MNSSIITMTETLINSILAINSLTGNSQVVDSDSLIGILLYIALTHPLYVVVAILFPLLAGFLLYLFIRQLPIHISQKAIETHKNELLGKLEFSKIIRSQVEPKKLEAYILFADTFGNLFSDLEAFKKLNQKKLFYDIGAKLYFFASDQTIKKYIELREHVFTPASSLNGVLKDPNVPIKLYSEIIYSMRKDLGYTDDFLKTIM